MIGTVEIGNQCLAVSCKIRMLLDVNLELVKKLSFYEGLIGHRGGVPLHLAPQISPFHTCFPIKAVDFELLSI